MRESELVAMQSARDYIAQGALSMIDWANHKPDNRGRKPKVGGHQASSMSGVDILCALYLGCKRPQDRVAVKPHAAPVIYAMMHLMDRLPEGKMGLLREMGGPQPYPTKLKDPLFVDYTTSSEALGVCATIYDAYGAIHQNLALRAHDPDLPEVDATYWAHCGDGELTEGQIDESLYDAGRWRLGNLVWIVDLNRQSLDRVMDDSGHLERWVRAKFEGQGWQALTLRWGSRARALFAREGGAELEALLDEMPDALFHPLVVLAGTGQGRALRRVLLGLNDDDAGPVLPLLRWYQARLKVPEERRRAIARCLEGVDDEALCGSLIHLGGHDLEALVQSLERARGLGQEAGPVVVIAHTVKGYETSAAGHPENHGALLPSEEVAAWGPARGLPEGRWPRPEPGSPAAELLARRAAELFDVASDAHAYQAAPVDDARGILGDIPFKRRSSTSTGEVFQSLNLALMRTDLGPWLQFGAPDVGQTTHLGPVIKATGVFAPCALDDPWSWLRDQRALAFDWRPSDRGQFHSLGIAEGNAMLWAYAFGRAKKRVEGRVPVLPVVTVYDKFFERGFNQLDYACYSDGRFVAVGTPSGTGLSRETATHQSLQTLRMMMDLPGIIAYEPAFGADVHAIYLHVLGQLWDARGEAAYLRLTTQRLEQPTSLPEDHALAAVRGAWWMVGEDDRAPRRGQPTVLFVASGRKLGEVREAAKILRQEDGVGSRILNVTSYEALWRDWDAYANDPSAWEDPDRTYYLHELFEETDVNAPLIMTGDHLPSACEWLPAALQRLRPARFLGPRRNGETGSIEAVDRLHGMATEDLVSAARLEIAWRQREGLIPA